MGFFEKKLPTPSRRLGKGNKKSGRIQNGKINMDLQVSKHVEGNFRMSTIGTAAANIFPCYSHHEVQSHSQSQCLLPDRFHQHELGSPYNTSSGCLVPHRLPRTESSSRAISRGRAVERGPRLIRVSSQEEEKGEGSWCASALLPTVPQSLGEAMA
jgi:hypothetical protein